MKNVLYITYDGLTDPLGQSQVLPYLVQLTKRGYRFTILSFEKKHRFEKEESIIRGIVDGAGIDWVPLMFSSRPPVLSKIYDRYRMWRTAIALHNKKKFDLVHCRSYVAAEVGLKLKRKYGVKFLFDMRGFWADEKVDNGQWDLNNRFFKKIYRHYKEREKEFLLNADGIVSLTQAARDYLVKQDGYQDLAIEVIPCCADLTHFDYHRVDPASTQSLKNELGIAEQARVITYLGSVGGWYMTKEMFAFFRRLLRTDPLFHMLILTKDDPGRVREEATAAGIGPEKITVSYAERQVLPVYLSLSSASIFFIRNTFSKKASSPTKHAELMGMGIPVLCNDIGDTGHIIRQTGTGIIIDRFDDDSLQHAVDNINQLDTIDREKIRSEAKKIFDLETGTERYFNLYQKIL